MKIKTLSIFLCIVAMTVSTLLFAGCGLIKSADDFDIVEVDTFAELKANSGNGIKLTADIDCDYETMQAFTVPYFDGDGHTVSNAVITCSSITEAASFFGNTTKEVKNVTFDNIKVSSTAGAGAGIVSAGAATSIENVHVKNCKVTCTQAKYNALTKPCYVGGIFGGSYSSCSGSAPQENQECIIKNSSVTNTEIEVTGLTSAGGGIYVGGIAGASKELKDCFAKEVKVSATSKTQNCKAYAGGLVATTSGSIENCRNTDSTITVNNVKKQGGTLGSDDAYGGDGYIGGISASLNTGAAIVYSFAKNNVITINAGGEVYAGGVVGKMSGSSANQSYSLSNNITAGNHYVEGIKSNITRALGGFVGEAKNCNIKSSFVYNNIAVVDNSVLDKYCDGYVCGFVGNFISGTISKCAVNYTEGSIVGTNRDAFSVAASGVTECVVSSGTMSNASNCEIATEDFWKNSAIEQLGLLGNAWSVTDEIPQLSFS